MPLPPPEFIAAAGSSPVPTHPGEAARPAGGDTELLLLEGGAEAAERFWHLLRSPRAPSGAVCFLRVLPRGAARLDPAALMRALLPMIEEARPPRGEPLLFPVGFNLFFLSFTGTYASVEVSALRDRLQAVLTRWALHSDTVAMVEVTDAFTWWGQSHEPFPGDGQHPVDALLQILAEESLSAVFQPIVSLKNGSVLGHEALIRGKPGSPLARPDALFACATRMGLLFEVDTLCQRIALAAARDSGLAGLGKLFLNIHPASLRERAYQGSPLVKAIEAFGVPPSQVVIELTERQAIHDFAAFESGLRAYRDAGFRVAVDDAGAGYSSLQAIAEVSPDYIKVDRSLVQGIDAAPNKRALLSVVAQFAGQIGTRLIAEGIETMAEMTTLIELGVEFGQGFYLARPEPVPEQRIPSDVSTRIVSAVQRRRRTLTGGGVPPIGELRIPGAAAHMLRPNEIVEVVHERFFPLDSGDGMPIVGMDGRPMGLLMKRNLQARLAMPYGHELLLRKLVMLVMDADPLVLESHVPMEEALQRLLARGQGKLDDHILVTDEDGFYLGYVPARRLLEQMSRIQISQARYANPLTGLPGNIQVEQEVNARLAADAALALLYVDLDNFKPFNDRYGVAHGDEVIRALGQTLLQTVDERGDATDLVGHLGGDDFLIVTRPEAAAALASDLVRRFEAVVPRFYVPEDRARGGFVAHDRNGVLTKFPMLTVSVAGIGNADHPLQDWLHATELLGTLKADVKRLPAPRILLTGLGAQPLPPPSSPRKGAALQGRKGGETARSAAPLPPAGEGAEAIKQRARSTPRSTSSPRAPRTPRSKTSKPAA